jgi:hypothetical protein
LIPTNASRFGTLADKGSPNYHIYVVGAGTPFPKGFRFYVDKGVLPATPPQKRTFKIAA